MSRFHLVLFSTIAKESASRDRRSLDIGESGPARTHGSRSSSLPAESRSVSRDISVLSRAFARRQIPRTLQRSGVLAIGISLLALLCLSRSGAAAERFRAASFDLASARRLDALHATELPESRKTVAQLQLREVRFSSLSWDESGLAQTMRIAASLAVPLDAGPPHSLPAVVIAHGLGGQADPADTMEIARSWHVVALSISAPGNGKAEGLVPSPQDSRSIFRVGKCGAADRSIATDQTLDQAGSTSTPCYVRSRTHSPNLI